MTVVTTTKTESPAGVKAVTAALADPFDPGEVKWKPQSVKGNRALAMAYIDARVIQDRLDDVLGVENWSDEYQLLPDGSVMCRLTLRLGDRDITKMDVGGPSEQPDGGDRLKAAVSDALKRAAVKFGVGRYLYRLPAQWADYDPVKKQFPHPPQMPALGRPRAAAPAAKPASPPPPPAKSAGALPANGVELHERLRKYDARLAERRVCPVGALLAHVAQAGRTAGYGEDIQTWGGPAIPFAYEAVKVFETAATAPKSAVRPASAA